MELPHIGQHCSKKECNQLDFLPFTCKLCEKVFCLDHHKYDDHNCPEKYRADAQVPICPLCNKPVPSKSGQTPDLAVNEHMENNCKNKKNKSYSSRCSLKSCRTKEVIPFKCEKCTLNFCVKHRHADDHECAGQVARREVAAAAAAKRQAHSSRPTNVNNTKRNSSSCVPNGIQSTIKNYFNSVPRMATNTNTRHATTIQVQGTMSEDEALARALAESAAASSSSSQHSQQAKQVPKPPRSAEEEDAMLAKAIAASLEDENGQNQRKSDGCSVS